MGNPCGCLVSKVARNVGRASSSLIPACMDPEYIRGAFDSGMTVYWGTALHVEAPSHAARLKKVCNRTRRSTEI